VIDISQPDGTLAPFTRVALPGRVPDKFKIDLLDDILRWSWSRPRRRMAAGS
jgi:hypothetical protein